MTEIHDDIVKLHDEEGKEHSFIVLNIIEVRENKYAIMIPLEDELSETEEQEAVIFRIDEHGDEQMLTVVEEGEEWEAVAEAWEEMSCMEEEDGEDEEDDEDDDEDYEDDEDDKDDKDKA